MLTAPSIIAATQQERTYGSARHRFGQSSAPSRRMRRQPTELLPESPNEVWDEEVQDFVRVAQAARGWRWSEDGKIVSYSIARRRYELIRPIRMFGSKKT